MKVLQRLALLASSLILCSTASAEAFPTKPINVVAPFAPGGSSDTIARVTGQKLSELLGQPVIVDNRPGANGSIGAAYVAKAPADGYTLLAASIGTYAINPGLYKKLSYAPSKDFDLLSYAVRTPVVLVASTKFPADSVAALIAYQKAHPQEVTYASAGNGSSDHLSAVLFWQKTGTTGTHVPYKGGGPAIADLLGGSANVSFRNLAEVANHIRSGKLKPLAIASEKRHPQLPNVPTMAEAGVKDMEVYSWQGFAAPKGLPGPVKDKLAAAIIASLKDPGVAKKLGEVGFDVVASTPKEFETIQAAEQSRWKAVIDAGNVTVD